MAHRSIPEHNQQYKPESNQLKPRVSVLVPLPGAQQLRRCWARGYEYIVCLQKLMQCLSMYVCIDCREWNGSSTKVRLLVGIYKYKNIGACYAYMWSGDIAKRY